MAEVVASFPDDTLGHRSPFHDLFTRISDGQTWKIVPADYREVSKNASNFRTSIQAWMRKRSKVAITRIDRKGNVYVRVIPQEGYVDAPTHSQ
jgi:hypothetical protein